MTDARFVYITAPDMQTAETIGAYLVENHLAACANILPGMQSIYRWQGKVERGQEVVLIAKTTQNRVEEVIGAVKSLHPYECPCIVSLPVEGGFPPYLKWIEDQSVKQR